jgi:hypothetical protein
VLSAPPILGAMLLGLEDLMSGRPTQRLEVASAQEALRGQLAELAHLVPPRRPVRDAAGG